MEKPKKKVFRALNNLEVQCEHKDHGCDSILSINNYDKHIQNECLFELVMCPYFGCEKEIPRKEF